MDTIFNRNKFRAVCIANGKTLKEAAQIMGISEVTMYRKFADGGRFTRDEITKYKDAFGLSAAEIGAIFFS